MVSATVPGGARAVARCDALGVPPYSDIEGGLYRGYLSPAYEASQQALVGWMEQAGMSVARDAAANLVGRYDGTDENAPALMIGSHLDSVNDGGRYDGPLGIMLGIECVAALRERQERKTFPIEVIAFGDEEGSRFPAAMLSSRAVAGILDASALDIADSRGTALADAGVDPAVYLDAVRNDGSVAAYFEAHIEQGPVLEREGLALCTVTGIAGQLRYRVTVRGEAGHAGTMPMDYRHDALAAASEMVLTVERTGREDDADLVATVGSLDVSPGAPNVIAGAVEFSLDIRSGDQQRRDRTAEAVLAKLDGIAKVRAVSIEVALVHDLAASPCDPALMDLLDGAVARTGQPVRRLVSGAGHDAMVMSALCPTAMLFIRCRGGISHNPAEHVEVADADVALAAMLGFIDSFGDSLDR